MSHINKNIAKFKIVKTQNFTINIVACLGIIIVTMLVPFRVLVLIYLIILRRWVLLLTILSINLLAKTKTFYLYPILIIFGIKSIMYRLKLIKKLVQLIEKIRNEGLTIKI